MTPLWTAQKPSSNSGVPLWGGEKLPTDGAPLWKPISGIIIDIDTLALNQRQALVASQRWHPVTLTFLRDIFLVPGQVITIEGVRENTCVLSISGNGSFVVESTPNPRTVVYRNPSSAHGVDNVYVSTPSGCRVYSGVADVEYAPRLNGVPVLEKPVGENPLWSPQTKSLWGFPQPTSGATLTGFYVITTGNVPCSVDWGDGNIQVIDSAAPTNHTY